MIKRYCGELEIGLQFTGRNRPENRATYCGYVKLPDGRRWNFADLQSGVGASGDRPENFDQMAESAVSFATYWTTHNRGDDTPDWAPAAELADAFNDAAEVGTCDYLITRNPA